MSSRIPFRSLAFRVHLTPAPRTQSESNAVLKALHELGPVAAFYVPSTEQVHHGRSSTHTASVVFAQNTRSVQALRDDPSRQTFVVKAHADVVPARVQDPYNIRGLKYRKPELDPRTISVRLSPVSNTQTTEEPHNDLPSTSSSGTKILDELADTPYRNTFAVDRASIFAEILARTDCPSGLIHGLLPRLDDTHRERAWDLELVKTSDLDREKKEVQGYNGRNAFVGADVVRLDGGRLAGELELERGGEDGVGEGGRYYDEFASLRRMSLMGMYRKAVGGEVDGTIGGKDTKKSGQQE